MPKFLTRQEVYRGLQRELPPDAYPDGAPSAFFSTAENDSIAYVAADAYSNASAIYANMFPQTATEEISNWEIAVFGRPLDTALSLSERRDRVLTRVRGRKGLTINDMISIVQSVIGSDKLVDISEWGCATGGWMIGISQLGIETILNGARLTDATGADLCAKDPSDFGKTEEEWAIMQEEAYTYQVNVYGYTLTATELAEVNAQLNEFEPARSQHVIVDGLDPNDMLGGAT